MTHAPDADLTPKQRYRKAYYAANKDKWEGQYRAKWDDYKAKRDEYREFLAKLKDVPCMDCGGRFPAVCMDFDHRDKAAKRINVAAMALWKRETILAEIAKCDIVCANCHRIRTFVPRT